MLRIFQYSDLIKVNSFLSFMHFKNDKVLKVDILAIDNKVQYFVLVDTQIQKKVKVKSKTEEIAKKEMKEKKEVKPDEVQVKK